MNISSSISATSATPDEPFSALMSKFMTHSPPRDFTWKKKDTVAEYSLDATSFVSQQVMDPDYELTDYKLEKDMAQVFPDFYYQFLRNFSKESYFNAAYCDRDFAAFKATLEGPESEIRRVMAGVKYSFHIAFKRCLGASFGEEYRYSFFDRTYVESHFVKRLIELKEWHEFGVRQNTVTGKALSGNVKPFVWFHKAFNFTDDEIWDRIYPLLIRGCGSREDKMVFKKKMESHQKKNGTVLDNMNDFIDCLVSKKLFVKRVPKSNQAQISTTKNPHGEKRSRPSKKDSGATPKYQRSAKGEKVPASASNQIVRVEKREGDNQGAIETVKNAAMIEGTKHIRVKADFIKSQLVLGRLDLEYVDTSDNVAKMLTKALPYPSLCRDEREYERFASMKVFIPAFISPPAAPNLATEGSVMRGHPAISPVFEGTPF